VRPTPGVKPPGRSPSRSGATTGRANLRPTGRRRQAVTVGHGLRPAAAALRTLRGEWHGQLAATLGLAGFVSAEAFDRLAEGQHPQTGEQLIQHRDTIKTKSGEEVGHRAGWDLTFNAPKTVSLTTLVGEDDRVREAHRSAVRAALSETEKYVQARLGGNTPAESQQVDRGDVRARYGPPC